MEEWKEVKLGEICRKVCSGGTPKSTVDSYYNGDIPWLNTKEISFNRIYDTEKYITQEGLENSSAKWVDKNTVIVAMYGATAAKCAITKIPLTTNQACCNLMIDETKADYRFVYYALCNEYVRLASLANGGAQQNLNAQQIKDYDIPYPPLFTQQKIANILSSLDDKIEVNRRINENLEAQAQALFKSWFVDFEPFKDGEFVESELGMIPKGWRVGTLGNYCKVKSGFAFKSSWWQEDGNKVIKIKNITSDGNLDMNDCSYVATENTIKAKDFQTKVGDLLIAMTGATIGKFCIVSSEEIMFVNQRVGKFFLGDNPIILLPFIYCALKYERIYSEIINKGQGSAQPNISGNDIENIQIAFSESTISLFNEKLKSLFSIIITNQQEITRLASLRDTLLPKLMSGEIDVNEVETIDTSIKLTDRL